MSVLCRRAGCAGVVEDGYCNRCGLAPVGGSVSPASAQGAGSGGWPGAAAASRSGAPPPPPPPTAGAAGASWEAVYQGARARGGAGFAPGPSWPQSSPKRARSVPPPPPTVVVSAPTPGWLHTVPEAAAEVAAEEPEVGADEEDTDPELSVMQEAVVPEGKRHCCRCDAPLRREEGFCGTCGAKYSFVPTLHAGDLLLEQYEVKGPLAFGGLGWLYLAYDVLLARYVVLKGLLNAQDTAAAVAAVQERRFLAAVKHPNIVGIYNFVQSGGEGFIVMEHVRGRTLKQMRQARGPLPPREALGYIAQVLPALGYLHAMGLVFCDFKPDNVMVEGGRVKLIDLGGVRRMDDPEGDIYGTEGYSAPEAGEGPTVASDLYTVGRCLAVLLAEIRGFCGEHRYALPPAGEVRVFREQESVYRLLVRSTARTPDERFRSAEAMEEQLRGVLREVTAEVRGVPQPGASQMFGGDPGVAEGRAGAPAQRPEPGCLPVPLPRLAGAERAALEEALVRREPAARVAALLALGRQRGGNQGLRVAAGLGLHRAGAGAQAMEVATELAAEGMGGWRVEWLLAVLAMESGRAAEALDRLELVYSELPGELAVKLAMGVAAELAGDLPRAAGLYGRVVCVDPAYVSAAFGLARCRVAAGDARGAVHALARVGPHSAAYLRARTQGVRMLLQGHRGQPAPEDVQAAAAMAESLALDDEDRLEMKREVLEAALRVVGRGRKARPVAGAAVMGCAMEERALRGGLEATLRSLARLSYGEERGQLLDAANAMRPVTLF